MIDTSNALACATETRRNFLALAAFGVAATLPEAASASGGLVTHQTPSVLRPSDELVRHISDCEQINQARKEVETRFNVLARSEPVGVTEEERAAWEKVSGIARLDELDEALFDEQCAAENRVCNFPCASVADVLEKVRFYFTQFDNDELDYSQQAIDLLQSMKALAFADTGSAGRFVL